MQFVPSCSRCLRRISDGQGSVLSCSHFVCDPCAYQPTKCPVCGDDCQAEGLLSPRPEVVEFLIPPNEALKQVISVLQFQEDHHSEIRRRFEEEKARLENKVGEYSRVLTEERADSARLKNQLVAQEKALARLQDNRDKPPTPNRQIQGGIPGAMKRAGPASIRGGASNSFFQQQQQQQQQQQSPAGAFPFRQSTPQQRRDKTSINPSSSDGSGCSTPSSSQRPRMPYGARPSPTPSPRGVGGYHSGIYNSAALPVSNTPNQSPRLNQPHSQMPRTPMVRSELTPPPSNHPSLTPRHSSKGTASREIIPQSPTARGDVSSYFDMMDRGNSGGPAAQQKALSLAATPQRSVQSTPSLQRNPLLTTSIPGHQLPQASPQATPQRPIASPSSQIRTAHVPYSTSHKRDPLNGMTPINRAGAKIQRHG